MSPRTLDPRLEAGLVAGAIFVLGAAAGVAGDRMLGRRAAAEPGAIPLTVQEMAGTLGLDPGERARVDAVLDSLRPEIVGAAAQGPDSLRAATRRARARIGEALPLARRPEFHRWLDTHHAQMMEGMHRMGPGMMDPGGMGPGTMDSGGMGRRMMGPDMMRPGGRSDSAGSPGARR